MLVRWFSSGMGPSNEYADRISSGVWKLAALCCRPMKMAGGIGENAPMAENNPVILAAYNFRNVS